jgi:protein-L-isoaspartate O-methyltransferase
MRESLGMRNVTMKNADGYDGWSEAGPFDCIMIAV